MKLRTIGFFSLGFFLLLLTIVSALTTACSNNSPSSSGSPTVTPTPATSSTAGHQLYAFVLANNGGGGVSMVAIAGPYSNTGSTPYSFSLPTPSGTSYIVAGFFDTNSDLTIPSGATTITPDAADYGQQSNNLCISTNTGQAFYSTTHSGINFTMSTANNACVFGTGQSVPYVPATGSGVVLSGTISQSGL